jgi:uncharacterized protein DUF892
VRESFRGGVTDAATTAVTTRTSNGVTTSAEDQEPAFIKRYFELAFKLHGPGDTVPARRLSRDAGSSQRIERGMPAAGSDKSEPRWRAWRSERTTTASGVQEARSGTKRSSVPVIDGLISEADEVAGEVADKDVLDAAIVGSAQAVEHYKIARYGTLVAWAESLGHDDIIRLPNQPQ